MSAKYKVGDFEVRVFRACGTFDYFDEAVNTKTGCRLTYTRLYLFEWEGMIRDLQPKTKKELRAWPGDWVV
jgi:hypothetical protein